MGLQLRPAMAPAADIPMTSSLPVLDDRWTTLAHRLWIDAAPIKVKPETIKTEIWDTLEAESFSFKSLVPLEALQIIERFLWPTFTEDASNHHVLLIAIFVNLKQRGHLLDWNLFTSRPDDFSALFRRVLSLSLDKSIPTDSQLPLLSFVCGAFQSIEKQFIRKECAPLVSIAIWHNLQSEDAQEKALESRNNLRKTWRAVQKRYDAADQATQSRMRFERQWLYSMLLDFLRRVDISGPAETVDITYCERFLEFLVDLSSQLPTRRYTITLIKDLNLLPFLKLSRLYRDHKNVLLRDLALLLHHFLYVTTDDDGQSKNRASHEAHYEALTRLQRAAMKHFSAKLKVLGLSNFASINSRIELQSHLSDLADAELEELCGHLGVRIIYPASANLKPGRELLLESLLSTYETPQSLQALISQLSILPTEQTLYDPALLRNESYDGSKPLAIPKLNLQYLSLGDFLWRSFLLNRSEALYEIRKDMETAVKRMKPRPGRERNSVEFDGFSKMSLPIAEPAIIEVGQPNVGTAVPSFVRTEVILDVHRLNEGVRREWENLRSNDVVFLLGVRLTPPSQPLLTNGHASRQSEQDWELAHVRCAEVIQVLDDNGRPLRDLQNARLNGHTGRPQRRRLLLNIDPAAYKLDTDKLAGGKTNVYSSINVIVRRQGRENNFKPVLETMQRLANTSTELPAWFQEVFLGYGDPRSASYPMANSTPGVPIDFLDTFLDSGHLAESFPGRTIAGPQDDTKPFTPPFVLKLSSADLTAPAPSSKKRRREEMENDRFGLAPIQASTYKPPNAGPYPTDIPNVNAIRFTPRQVEALTSGVHPGLTVIVGPPGTGKTDVAAQLIHLLCSNYPDERILLVAHSNQALNQLFQKITALDIDPRHLLRLGHGEEELDTEASYSKAGRVESFLENRQGYLSEVNRLAVSIGAEGAHSNSCETAEYFNQVYIEPAWVKFWDTVKAENSSTEIIKQSFPFYKYFSTAPVPELFPSNTSSDEIIEIAQGCHHHIRKIFRELATVRPFEILRHPRDQANHLLVKEARIIAMTSTHAAMRRSEIAGLGFHYDTLIMEEAAQVTEIESFIPCAMQTPDPKTGELPLKRVVLVGDHLQNSPIIQNMAFRQYANFEQSMFLRLVRLGVPTINLDQQGRCRPSIADLFRWRYSDLGDLPYIMKSPEFARANAGFRYDYQFIDVPDYQGQGEREPSAHFIQNLGEAEYAVALFQYMRLLGYPARSISILASYAGQKVLIRDVLDHRCKENRLFGLPRIVTTVDKYQGEQNDFVIVSMTRTRSVGYLRDVRRLTVALSRARLGLYILGRRELFETCFEMKPAMEILTKRPGKLLLTTGEMYPTERKVGDDVEGTEMDGVEHLGQYVYEMTQAKVKALGGQVMVSGGRGETAQEGYGDVEEPLGGVDEEDPLHEEVV